ncbi:MAG: hypothetical protein APF81_26065 [Desulfosporosinus sp. BRH_c37]|nr:MAG: hypothetical protein APF81_26065 [Desulfosporosinus sp. BRH_c37]
MQHGQPNNSETDLLAKVDGTDVADYVHQGGHGTRVAGAVLYPGDIPYSSTYKQTCWLQNARVLNEDNKMPLNLFPPKVLKEIAGHPPNIKILPETAP